LPLIGYKLTAHVAPFCFAINACAMDSISVIIFISREQSDVQAEKMRSRKRVLLVPPSRGRKKEEEDSPGWRQSGAAKWFIYILCDLSAVYYERLD